MGDFWGNTNLNIESNLFRQAKTCYYSLFWKKTTCKQHVGHSTPRRQSAKSQDAVFLFTNTQKRLWREPLEVQSNPTLTVPLKPIVQPWTARAITMNGFNGQRKKKVSGRIQQVPKKLLYCVSARRWLFQNFMWSSWQESFKSAVSFPAWFWKWVQCHWKVTAQFKKAKSRIILKMVRWRTEEEKASSQ